MDEIMEQLQAIEAEANKLQQMMEAQGDSLRATSQEKLASTDQLNRIISLLATAAGGIVTAWQEGYQDALRSSQNGNVHISGSVRNSTIITGKGN